jgi:hypothetical protein
MSGPPKEKPLLGGEGLHKRIEGGYAAELALQTAWPRWQWQAATFVAEFWRTGDERHLAAFVRHVSGMRGQAERRTR